MPSQPKAVFYGWLSFNDTNRALILDNILDIRIIGIDEKRPPIIRKEPYIDLFFKLSCKPPEDWCEDFNAIGKNLVPPVKIDKTARAFIDAYVRDMNYIPEHLAIIRKKITACNEKYIESMRLKELAAAEKNASLLPEDGEQRKLNSIVAALKFDD